MYFISPRLFYSCFKKGTNNKALKELKISPRNGNAVIAVSQVIQPFL
jgi:hypothetical protein